jgi:hypothetical protein
MFRSCMTTANLRYWGRIEELEAGVSTFARRKSRELRSKPEERSPEANHWHARVILVRKRPYIYEIQKHLKTRFLDETGSLSRYSNSFYWLLPDLRRRTPTKAPTTPNPSIMLGSGISTASGWSLLSGISTPSIGG